MLRFNGFYLSESERATIEAPTPSGKYSFRSYMMYRFYESGIWIKANSLDTNSKEFWQVSQKIDTKELNIGLKRGSAFLSKSGKNHSLDIGKYEIEDSILFVSFEYFESDDDEKAMFSDMYSWKIEDKELIGEENNHHLVFTFV